MVITVNLVNKLILTTSLTNLTSLDDENLPEILISTAHCGVAPARWATRVDLHMDPQALRSWCGCGDVAVQQCLLYF